MASLKLAQLSEHLDQDAIGELERALDETDSSPLELDEAGDSAAIDQDLDDDIFVDFLDRLEATEAAADIYVPSEFEDTLRIGEHRIGSAHALILALESLKDELGVEKEDLDPNEVDGEADELEPADDESIELFGASEDEHDDLKQVQLRHIWSTMQVAAKAAIERSLCLVVKS